MCLSSDELKNKVLKASGCNASLISDKTSRHDKNNCFVVSGGSLPCKNIIFVPWTKSTGSFHTLEKSMHTFMESAFQCAQQHSYKTISFHAVGEYPYVF